MKFTVVRLRAAQHDCDRILDYIAARSKQGAEAFDKASIYLEK